MQLAFTSYPHPSSASAAGVGTSVGERQVIAGHLGRPGAARRTDGAFSGTLAAGAALTAGGLCVLTQRRHSRSCKRSQKKSVRAQAVRGALPAETEVVIIGAGLGGLAAAATLAKSGRKVTVVEAHTACGGCAHAFTRKAPEGGEYLFDSGPSIVTEMGPFNPLQQVLDYVDASEYCEWIYYDGWGMLTPEGRWNFKLGPGDFRDKILPMYGVPTEEFDAVLEASKPLAETGHAIPGLVLRDDSWQLLPLLLKFPGGLLPAINDAPALNQPFSDVLDRLEAEGKLAKGSWLRKWLDALAFSLSGLDCSGTTAAAMAFTVDELHRSGSKGLAYPKGGMGSIVDALVKSIEKHGGAVHTGVRVEEILVEQSASEGEGAGLRHATGVRLAGGKTLMATSAVICNAAVWDAANLIPQAETGLQELRKDWQSTPMTRSYLHLHVGLDAKGLELDKLLPHYTQMMHWDDVTGEQNMVAISNPSLLDDSLCPPGKLVLHLYCAGNEPYDVWEEAANAGGRKAIDALKEERGERLWKALETVIPDARQRVEVSMIGSPLTHKRFLRRAAGTYGPAPLFGHFGPGNVPFRTSRDAAVERRGEEAGIDNLILCGDSTFPGIGVPAAVISGCSAAHSVMSVWEHMSLLGRAGY
eukprot:TRINITY_DN25051_c0_g1_i1.p1 TRINITY_DN25051_c0_g1~~TRINITY_DN25051_c0_g1_i1.p1  ORF type:complete len:642 (+),score=107.03 TRINITY_DN25051_c0_g1_i1:64-1989(+)